MLKRARNWALHASTIYYIHREDKSEIIYTNVVYDYFSFYFEFEYYLTCTLPFPSVTFEDHDEVSRDIEIRPTQTFCRPALRDSLVDWF